MSHATEVITMQHRIRLECEKRGLQMVRYENHDWCRRIFYAVISKDTPRPRYFVDLPVKGTLHGFLFSHEGRRRECAVLHSLLKKVLKRPVSGRLR